MLSRLGLAKIGLVTALINSNLRKESLLHVISTADSKALVFGLELENGEVRLKNAVAGTHDVNNRR